VYGPESNDLALQLRKRGWVRSSSVASPSSCASDLEPHGPTSFRVTNDVAFPAARGDQVSVGHRRHWDQQSPRYPAAALI
jgi:hypothetical protein